MASVDASSVETVAQSELPFEESWLAVPWQLNSSEPDAVAQVLAPAVQQLFDVTLTLEAMAARSDVEVSGRLAEAVGQIDVAIQQLRSGLLRLTGVRAPSAA